MIRSLAIVMLMQLSPADAETASERVDPAPGQFDAPYSDAIRALSEQHWQRLAQQVPDVPGSGDA